MDDADDVIPMAAFRAGDDCVATIWGEMGRDAVANDCNVFLESMIRPSGNAKARNGMVLRPPELVAGVVVVVVVVVVMVWIDVLTAAILLSL